MGVGHKESALFTLASGDAAPGRFMLSLLQRCKVYQFHNTSQAARIRQHWNIDDNRYLREDGANLAPFLLRLRADRPEYYARIVETVRLAAPFFADFELEPRGGGVMLQWRETGADMLFGPHQASDGTLRLIALVTLLLQPTDEQPNLIVLDEPELGLHPFAITMVAGLLKSAAVERQFIVATQSSTLLDHFVPDNIIVVDRVNRQSLFRRLDPERLRDWLDEYSLSELWDKNVSGGRPHQ